MKGLVKMNLTTRTGANILNGLKLSIFNDEELDRVHEASLEILSNKGMYFQNEEALEVLHSVGCRVDKTRQIVKIPPHLVEESVASIPATLTLGARDPDNDYTIGGTGLSFSAFGEATTVHDPYSRKLRSSSKMDLAAACRLQNSLDIARTTQRSVSSLDVDQKVMALHNFEAMIHNTTKPCFISAESGEELSRLYMMAEAVMGGRDELLDRPLFVATTCPVSPFKIINDSCEILMTAARAHMPTRVTTLTMCGGTGPITLAGTLVLQNAEFLACAVLHQAVCKGAPLVRGSSTTTMDLKYGSTAVGSPELALLSAANAKLCRRYKIPSWLAGG